MRAWTAHFGATSKRIAIAACTMVVALGASACGGSDSDDQASSGGGSDDPITIGVAAALSGGANGFDGPPIAGLRQWASDVNGRGGVEGRRVKLIFEDNKSDVNRSAAAGQAVLSKGADIVVATCDFDLGSPAARAANTQRKVAISLCAGSPLFGVEGIGPYAFTIGTGTPVVGGVLAEFASQREWKKAFVLTDVSTQYSKGIAESFKTRWQELGGTIAGEDTFQNDDPSIGSQVDAIRRSDADVVLVSTLQPGGVTAFKQIRSGGIDLPLLTSDGFDGDYWLDAVPNLSDLYVPVVGSIFGDDPDERVNEFVRTYAEVNGDPPPSALALLGYSLGEALQKAIEASGGKVDGDSLKTALEQFDGVELLHGEQTFTPTLHIDPARTMRIVKLDSGRFAYVTSVTPRNVRFPGQ